MSGSRHVTDEKVEAEEKQLGFLEQMALWMMFN